jgi:outer membrane protein OmpA-like peptidoglycan-associated protein
MSHRTFFLGIVFALGASCALAAEEGPFIGAGVGQSTAKASVNRLIGNKLDYDENSNAYKGYVGYNFTRWLGVEGGYVDLGDSDKKFVITTPVLNGAKVKVSPGGWQGFGVVYLPIGPIDIFGKIGGIAASVDVKTSTGGFGQPPQHDTESESRGMLAYGGGAAWNFGHWAIRAEYEAYDVSKLDDLYVVSGSLQYTFFHEKEQAAPVAATPPPPPPKPAPAAPAKCPDADKDGVCDANDACPNTPPGTRVGPAGCDCDYVLRTHFAFDSAELTAEDKTALDQLARTLVDPRLHFVTGEIDGYTDSTGEPQYNLGLSKRRADAVAAYLKSKGVAFGDRFITQGFGEERPIADNKTEEGRAQNRRVSIHRTDCESPPKP